MGYMGVNIPIVLGQNGLVTDDPISSLPLNALAKANNISFQNGRISKMKGNTKLNSSALTSQIVSLNDYWPTSALQRTIALTSDGKLWRDTGDGTFSTNSPIKTGLGAVTTDASLVAGGQESSGKNKKLFVLTGTSQVQVLDGDSSIPAAIAFPSPDWATGSYPSFAVPYQNRMCLLGSAADRHRAYFSTISDHENFVGQVFPTQRWELWQRIAATPNTDATSTIQAGTATTVFTATNNDGVLIYGVKPFNRVTFNCSQASTGTPIYTYEYWNGALWISFTPSTIPSFSSTGSKTLEFTAPVSWVVGDGSEGGGNNAYYAIRILATTAPATAVKITSMTVENSSSDLAPPTFSVFPGESDGIVSAYVYRGLLFLFKRPFGVYIIDGRDPLTANWTVYKYADSFGAASPHGVVQILGDLVISNSMGSITSLQASQVFGDFDAGDLLQNAKVEEYIRNQFDFTGIPYTHAIYYPEKKIALFTGRGTNSTTPNRMIAIDVARQSPRIYLINKDNPNCLALRKDTEGISRPMYGTQDGFVYLMDQTNYNNSGSSYLGEFQTAYTDFGQADLSLANKNKIFDFIEVNYVPTGNNYFYIDVYIDGEFRQTLSFYQSFGVPLDSFVLDSDSLAGDPAGNRNRKPLKSCTGNKISFRVYNNSSNEAFQVERLIVSFRVSGEQLYSGQV